MAIRIKLAYLPAIEFENGEFIRFDSYEEYFAAIEAAENPPE